MADKLVNNFTDRDIINLVALANCAIDADMNTYDGFCEDEIEHLKDSILRFNEINAELVEI